MGRIRGREERYYWPSDNSFWTIAALVLAVRALLAAGPYEYKREWRFLWQVCEERFQTIAQDYASHPQGTPLASPDDQSRVSKVCSFIMNCRGTARSSPMSRPSVFRRPATT